MVPLTSSQESSAEARIAALGSDDAAVRRRAADDLLAMGPDVLRVLKRHAGHPDERVREEVRRLIERIEPIRTIEFWTYNAPGADPYWAEVKRVFESENPGVCVRMVTGLPGRNLQQKMNLRFIAGDPPDTMIVNDWWTATLNQEGMLQPLDGFIENDPSYRTGDFPRTMVDDGYVGKRRFSIPYYGGYPCLIYRLDLFERAGADPPRTWDELISVGQTLRRKLGMKHPLGLEVTAPFYTITMIWQNGGEVIDAEHRRVVLGSPEAIGALRFVHDLMYKYKIVDPGLARGTRMNALWGAGKIAMMYDGAWKFGTLDRDYPHLRGKWAVAPLPAGRRRVAYYGGQHAVMPTGAKHPELAWKFMVLVTRPDMQVLMADRLGRPPANLRAYDDPGFRARHPHMTTMRPWMVKGRNYRFAPFFWDIKNVRFKNNVLDSIMPDPSADIDAVVRGAVKEMQTVADGYWERRRYFRAGRYE